MSAPGWPFADMEFLKAEWAAGTSTAEIGRRFSPQRSKNSVIGMAHRLKLPSRPNPIGIKGQGKQAGRYERRRLHRALPKPPAVTLPTLAALKPEPVPAVAFVAPVRRPIVVNSKVRCCWPIGEPGTPGFTFCKAMAVQFKPYCDFHCSVAYVRPREAVA